MTRQPDLFTTPIAGSQLKAQALTSFIEREGAWMKRARDRMVEWCREHPDLEVSSDEVWKLCPPPADAHPSCMGPIFRDSRFVRVGTRATKRPSGHARIISTYALKESIHGR